MRHCSTRNPDSKGYIGWKQAMLNANPSRHGAVRLLDVVGGLWLHARVIFSSRLFVSCCWLVGALCITTLARAADLPGVDLPPGEAALQMAWSTEASLVLLTQLNDGYAVRRLDLTSGDVSVIAIPKEFSYFKPGKNGKVSPQFILAPRGNALAVIEPADGALVRSQIAVYSISASAMSAVNNRRIPGDFWPEHAVWDTAGKKLYISARPYIFPEQIYSVGMLDRESGDFSGVVLKDNLDLIDSLACVQGRDALAVRCAGYQGQYPEQPLVALVDLERRTSHILHSQAAGLSLEALADGSLLIFPNKAGKQGNNAEYWVLEAGAVTLRRAKLPVAESASSLQMSSDGTWFGFLAPEKVLTGKGEATKQLLALQRAKDGKTVVAATATESFCFSPSGKRVSALAAGKQRLYFYELPANE
jgi:hypothetical protein